MAKFNEISEFLGGSREVNIGKDKTLTIYPLSVSDIPQLNEETQNNMTDEEKMNLSHNMILKSLNDSTVTIEDIKRLPALVYTKLMEGINKFNGFVDEKDESVGAIKEKITRIKDAKQK